MAQKQCSTPGNTFKEGGGCGWGMVLKMSISCKSVSRTFKPQQPNSQCPAEGGEGLNQTVSSYQKIKTKTNYHFQ